MGQRREGDRIEMWDTTEDLSDGPFELIKPPPFYKRPAYWIAAWLFVIVAIVIIPYPWYVVGPIAWVISLVPTMIAMHREDKRLGIYADGFKALKEAEALSDAYWEGYLERSAREFKKRMKKSDAEVMARRNQLNLDFRWKGEKDIPPPKYTAPYHRE